MPAPSILAASAMFSGTGLLHFARPDIFESIVPDWFPDKRLANLASGAAEVVFGLGLLSERTRRVSALGLVVVVAAVYPANVDMAINDVEVKPVDGRMTRSKHTARGVARAINWVRLPLQFPIAYSIWRVAQRERTADG